MKKLIKIFILINTLIFSAYAEDRMFELLSENFEATPRNSPVNPDEGLFYKKGSCPNNIYYLLRRAVNAG